MPETPVIPLRANPSVNLPQFQPLWPEGCRPFPSPEDGSFPNLTLYLPSPEHREGPSVLVLPGGGYGMLSSPKEGHRPAQYLNAHGIAAAVLEYRHSPRRHPVPLVDAQRALRVLRAVAREEMGLDPERVGVMGFSAGGHLAGTLCTQPEVPEGRMADALDAEGCRPDFGILVYPVVSLSESWSHFGSRDNLLGTPADATVAETLSIERAVTAETPPLFLVHAQDDPGVPSENSVRLYQALTACGVPAELHLYARGGHGFGMAANHAWTREMLRWLAESSA